MWSRAPLFRLAIAFFSGQYIYPSVPSILAYSLAIGLFFLLFIFHYFFTRIWSYHQRHQGGFLIFIMVLFWGMTCGKINEEVHLDFPSDSNQVLTALEITGAARERNSSIRYICRIVDTTTEDFNAFLGSSIWLYVKKDSSAYFKVGNTVCIENYPKALQGPQNPGEFDFREYSSRKGIYGMAYVQPDEIHRVDSTCKQSIFTTIRSDMLLTLDNSSLDHAQLGVIKALAMGYKDDLETDQREDFARAGAMHVLAVSGLHVGLIYMVLNAILRVPPGFRKLRIIKGIVVITFIWLYAGITDFSPSVLRSSTMFTFLVTGDLLGRRLSTLNSIAASAFFLVCLEPNIIHQLGFQLSYLAVCGIVIFHPFLASLIKTRFK
ncbi:MAG: competence protein ComEC, partial [Litorivivens sp.]